MTYRSLRQLEEQRSYKIVRTEEREDKNILLFLKGYGDEEEFMSLLLPRSLHPAFRSAKRQNIERNGEAAELKLKYYGCTNFDGGNPIIRISGKGFTRYLM